MAGSHERKAPAHPARRDLHAFADGGSSPAGHLLVARHLADCDACAVLVERLEHTAGQLASLPTAEVPEDFTARVMMQLRTSAPPRRMRRSLRAVALVGAALASAAALQEASPAIGALEGIGRLLRPGSLPTSDLVEMVFTFASAALGGLGRAMDGLLAPPALVPSVQPLRLLPHLPMAAAGVVALLAAAALLAIGRARLRPTRT